jgi:hypothetical protein
VAGYVSTEDEWRKFQKEWQRELDRVGVHFFHMVKYEARVKDEQGNLR